MSCFLKILKVNNIKFQNDNFIFIRMFYQEVLDFQKTAAIVELL